MEENAAESQGADRGDELLKTSETMLKTGKKEKTEVIGEEKGEEGQ